MITIRLSGLLSLGMACAFTGVCQSNTPPQFYTHTAPATEYPNTRIYFAEYGSDAESHFLSYDLLEGPTNAAVHTVTNSRLETYAAVSWLTPSRSAIGTTNTFVIRVTDYGSPPLSGTGIVNIVMIEPPQIHSISLSNKVPVLQLNDLLANKAYYVEWTAALPATNWAQLATLDWVYPNPRPPVIRIADTNQIVTQRFYRIIPRGWECYGGCADFP